MSKFIVESKNFIKNPLGIIGLFVVIIYALAGLVFAFQDLQIGRIETISLIGFLIVFPFVVLTVFYRLVTKYPVALYSPSDFSDESALVNLQKALLSSDNFEDRAFAINLSSDKLMQSITKIGKLRELAPEGVLARILWVDDNPQNNEFITKQLVQMGIEVIQSESTQSAMQKLETTSFASIISDMGRNEGDTEGYKLLDKVRALGLKTPYYIFAGSDKTEHNLQTIEAGGNGSTNSSIKLTRWILADAVNSFVWDVAD